MFFKKKSKNYSATCEGVVTGVSSVKVNNRHLPLVDYYVNEVKYTLRMPANLARKLEESVEEKSQIVRANLNFGTSFSGQKTKLLGVKVQIEYDESNPKEARIKEF